MSIGTYSNRIGTLTGAGISSPLGWGYQDFTTPGSTNLTLTSNNNGTNVPFSVAKIISSTAVIVRKDNTDSFAYSGTTALFSTKISVSSHTTDSITLNAIPHANWGDLRVYYLYNYGSLPVNYELSPAFIRNTNIVEIDNLFITEEEFQTGAAIAQWNANKINSVTVDNTDIADGKVLTYNSTSGNIEYETPAAGGGFSDPMTTRGDIIYKNAAGTTTRLAAGTATYVLTSDGTDISWAAASGGGGGFDPDVDAFNIGTDAVSSGTRSVALGQDAEATNTNCIAIGYSSDASGSSAFALGYNTNASMSGSTAIGSSASAITSNFSTAVGASTVASGLNSLAMGYSADAETSYAIAIGSGAQAKTGTYTTAIGYNAQATGSVSITMGRNSSSTATRAVAIGESAHSTHSYSTALGPASVSTRDYQIVLGSTSTVDITVMGGLFLEERASAEADKSGFGQMWIRSSDGVLCFTDNSGTDYTVNVTAI